MDENSKTILNLLLTKSALKQDISEDTQDAFKHIKTEVRSVLQELKGEVSDDRIRLNFIDTDGAPRALDENLSRLLKAS